MSPRARTLQLAIIPLLLWVGCRRGPTEQVGHRVEPQAPRVDAATGLTFPLDPPASTALVAVPAFSALTLRQPLALISAPGEPEHLFVAEKGGRVLRFEKRDDVTSSEVFLDIRDRVRTRHDEEGLLGLAFPPDYAETGAFYVSYSASGPRRTQVSRFHRAADGSAADPDSEEPLLAAAQPYGNHNGGSIGFGPRGFLYAGFGDGGAAGDPLQAGQDLSTWLGSIVRIDVGAKGPYRVPPDNPFVDVPAAKPEIWAYGLRNPWRFSFDRRDGTMWVGDVGQDSLEEVDIIERGGNYGWRLREAQREFADDARSGRAADAPLLEPVVSYGRRAGVSITGGFVYRGTHLPAFRGLYFYGDYGSGTVWALDYDGMQVVSNEVVATVPALASFGEDAAGELYAVSHGGAVYRFELPDSKASSPAFPTRLSQTGLFSDVRSLTPQPGLRPYDVAWPFWSDGAEKQRWLALPQGGTVDFRAGEPWSFPVGTVAVKHFELALDDQDPSSRRRLETRVMVHEARGWAGYTYRWNEAQTDAQLITAPTSERFVVQRAGVTEEQVWEYPAGSDCMRCHNPATGGILGLGTRQLAGDAGVLERWAEAGVFSKPIPELGTLPAHPQPGGPGASAEAQARAYLDVNCGVCHRPGGPAPGSMDLRAGTALAEMGLVEQRTEESVGGGPPLRLHAGKHGESALWHRVSTESAQRMPPLSSSRVDEAGASLLAAWIDGM